MNYICSLVARFVFKGLNGTSLILPLLILLYVVYGQVKDFKRVFKQILNEGRN